MGKYTGNVPWDPSWVMQIHLVTRDRKGPKIAFKNGNLPCGSWGPKCPPMIGPQISSLALRKLRWEHRPPRKDLANMENLTCGWKSYVGFSSIYIYGWKSSQGVCSHILTQYNLELAFGHQTLSLFFGASSQEKTKMARWFNEEIIQLIHGGYMKIRSTDLAIYDIYI